MSQKNSVVATYESHANAEAAVRELKQHGFDMKKLSIEAFLFSSVLFCVMLARSIGSPPVWLQSSSWGYSPSSGISMVLMIFLFLWRLFGGLSPYGHQGWRKRTPAPVMNR